ncbi:OVARIAN TUMOR DOMAIN-containing deubiquitinating enzyme 4 [Ricinus communis]|uniref:OVARIAN TUMOR DOMAIN-containing deubiquitinating enzyme 4 n=1 Tax=Ricinus communis TaxID=3988 RepID=UPI00201B1AE7|nr:OVARIAN TUMOR DOMAIN-containing deubiquitinating enzyme 4 [Ricinus communis]XP_015583893.2 OVARIAN TUMOR DOMAIN-containing deubiquitinating enzyme 4 [Ricinus communis]
MIVCSPISTYARKVVYLSGCAQHMGSTIFNMVSNGQSTSCCFCSCRAHLSKSYARLSISKTFSSPSVGTFQTSNKNFSGSGSAKQSGSWQSITVKGLFNTRGPLKKHFNLSLAYQNLNMRFSLSKRGMLSKIKDNVGSISWAQECASTGLICGLLVCYSSSEPTRAEAAAREKDEEDNSDLSYVKFSHGKRVYTDYSITGIPGDGRCLFRSVAHGASLRTGKPAPSESLQRELADDLRARVADEFIRRRQETEWFIEGDFDTYVAQMRKPHVWGGEPELFMASHVLKMPITVYMYDQNARGLISIAEYGEEYGKDNPIRVLYHGFGHYDALQIPGRKGGKPKL